MANVYQATHQALISETIVCIGSMVILTTTTLTLIFSLLLKLSPSTLTTDGILEDHGDGKTNNINVLEIKEERKVNKKLIFKLLEASYKMDTSSQVYQNH